MTEFIEKGSFDCAIAQRPHRYGQIRRDSAAGRIELNAVLSESVVYQHLRLER
jgi:hypothetical protein